MSSALWDLQQTLAAVMPAFITIGDSEQNAGIENDHFAAGAFVCDQPVTNLLMALRQVVFASGWAPN